MPSSAIRRKSSATCASGGKLVAVGVGRERAVGDALDEEALVAGAQKLPVRDDARGWRRRDVVATDLGIGLDGSAHNRAMPVDGATSYCISS